MSGDLTGLCLYMNDGTSLKKGIQSVSQNYCLGLTVCYDT